MKSRKIGKIEDQLEKAIKNSKRYIYTGDLIKNYASDRY
jgi:hypothetical protein